MLKRWRAREGTVAAVFSADGYVRAVQVLPTRLNEGKRALSAVEEVRGNYQDLMNAVITCEFWFIPRYQCKGRDSLEEGPEKG